VLIKTIYWRQTSKTVEGAWRIISAQAETVNGPLGYASENLRIRHAPHMQIAMLVCTVATVI